MDITIKDNDFSLHSTGAMYWKERQILLISDVHLGKVSHFRKSGAAVPRGAIQKNFTLLSRALEFFNPSEVYFLGDLFHSYLNQEWQLFENWLKQHPQKFTLVSGNHDIISPLKFEKISVTVVSEIVEGPFLFTHHPEERTGLFNFSGHLHPAIRMKGKGRQSLRLPCFYRNDNQMILPAFGEFTGTHVLSPRKDERIYAIAQDTIIDVSPTI